MRAVIFSAHAFVAAIRRLRAAGRIACPEIQLFCCLPVLKRLQLLVALAETLQRYEAIANPAVLSA